ncbi:MAG: flavin-nucleotide-binding protein [Henriciella sp.]
MSAEFRSEIFHAGELAVQERLGVRDQIGSFAPRVVRDHMPEQHRSFYHALPLLFIGAQDDKGWPWASILAGPDGFISSPDKKILEVSSALPPFDPLHGSLSVGSAVGVLGLEFHSRRRNRMSAELLSRSEETLRLGVRQTFGNCPQYIHRRTAEPIDPALNHNVDASCDAVLDDRAAAIIAAADTMFIASSFSDGSQGRQTGADVSHRGGMPGFVEVVDRETLCFPDYAGNNHFNTIGNLVMDPRAGLLFVDFESGGLLFISVQAEIIWDGVAVDTVAGAQRLIRCHIRQVRYVENGLSMKFGFIDHSPSFRSHPNFEPKLRAGKEKES